MFVSEICLKPKFFIPGNPAVQAEDGGVPAKLRGGGRDLPGAGPAVWPGRQAGHGQRHKRPGKHQVIIIMSRSLWVHSLFCAGVWLNLTLTAAECPGRTRS